MFQTAPLLPIHGVHHTARPTWKLRETVEFYRDKLGLPLVHAITARGWPVGHPDFLHFFFDSGNSSTIAFFYYIGTSCPDNLLPTKSHFFTATHTAWQVRDLLSLETWRKRLESFGIPVHYQTRHEIIESLYFSDPNGYPIEITYQLRQLTNLDAADAARTIAAAIELEDLHDPTQLASVDDVWRRKGISLEAITRGGA